MHEINNRDLETNIYDYNARKLNLTCRGGNSITHFGDL